MCSNEVLKERMGNVLTKLDSFIDLQTKEHKEIFDKFDSLDEKYPTRRELKAIKRAGGVIMTIVGVLSTLGIVAK